MDAVHTISWVKGVGLRLCDGLLVDEGTIVGNIWVGWKLNVGKNDGIAVDGALDMVGLMVNDGVAVGLAVLGLFVVGDLVGISEGSVVVGSALGVAVGSMLVVGVQVGRAVGVALGKKVIVGVAEGLAVGTSVSRNDLTPYQNLLLEALAAKYLPVLSHTNAVVPDVPSMLLAAKLFPKSTDAHNVKLVDRTAVT